MRTQIIITSASVENLKQKARKLKRESGISHHEALDLVAKEVHFNHWHHVAESAKAFEPTERAYYFGVIIAMDVKDAMDFRDPSGRFVEDSSAFALCADDIYRYIREADEDADMLATDPHYEEDRLEWMEEGLMNFVFFRYTASTVPGSVDEVAGIVNECSFWPPEFIWYNNSFQEW
jgi:hypothetical protein